MKPSTRLTNLARLACAALAFAALCPAAHAQRGPQDNWTHYGTQFSSPTPTNNLSSIAIGSGGVYVGEQDPGTGNPTKLLRFTEAGTFVSRFTATFGYILGLACDSAGNVYVLDRGDSRVKVYDQNGTFIRQWGAAGSADGQFSFGTQTGPTMLAMDRNDQVYVADPGNTRVQVFDTNGTFLRKWGQLGALPGQFPAGTPTHIAVSSDDRVYAGAGYYAGNGPKIFDTNGNYLKTYSFPPYATVTEPFTTSGDGLIYHIENGYFDIADFNRYFSVTIFGSDNLRSSDAAFSKRGDLYCVSGTHVSIFKREYESSKNFLTTAAIPQPVVLSANQRAGTSLLDIDYKVTDADSPTVTTGLLAFRKSPNNEIGGTVLFGEAVVMSTFMEGTAGNVGANQPTGVTRHATWNMPADWAVDYADIQVEALAKDSRNLMGVHWITVPASGGNPAFQVSSKPVTDADLNNLWFWFLATHQGTTLSSALNVPLGLYLGKITGNTGIYSGASLAEDVPGNYGTTARTNPSGRLFAYEKMGVRAITGSELVRAQAGNYGFTGLDAWATVVKDASVATSYLKGWGYNGYGLANWLSFAGANPVQVSTSSHHALILRADGTLWAVGHNHKGQLGDGTTTDRIGPVFIASGVAQVAAALSGNVSPYWYDSATSYFVKTDGTLWGMGANNFGQLGDGSTTDRSVPVQIATGVSQVAAGGFHAVFLKTNGTLWSTGRNNSGQLGDGTTTDRNTPVQIATGVSQASAGEFHTLFVKTNGTLWGAGSDGEGRLGDGGLAYPQTSTPIQVATGVARAVAGPNHSLFVKSNGTLWAMGSNSQGQLGDGSTADKVSPVQIATDVSTAAAGRYHSVFLRTDGTVWAMGNNSSGQLGDGTTTQRLTPVQVDAGATGIAAGESNSLVIVVPAP